MISKKDYNEIYLKCCEICGKEILRDSQCINYKYYHNDCIENLQQENNQLKCNWNKLKEYLNYKSGRAVGEDEYVYDEIYNEMQEIIGDKE